MNLFEINQTLRSVLERGFSVDEETGEVLFDTTDLLNLENSKAEKMLAIAKVIKEKEAFASLIKEQENAMSERRKVIENQVTRLKKWALLNMTEKEAFEDATIKVSYFAGLESVEIPNLEKIDPRFVIEKSSYSADKTAIKEALTKGEIVYGASLVRKASLRIK